MRDYAGGLLFLLSSTEFFPIIICTFSHAFGRGIFCFWDSLIFGFLPSSPRPPHKAPVSRLIFGSGKQCKGSRETRRWGEQGEHVARQKKIGD